MRKFFYFFLISTVVIVLSVQCESRENRLFYKKAAKMHEKALTLDSHTDTPLNLDRFNYDLGVSHKNNPEGGQLDFPRMKKGGLDAAFFAVFIGQGPRTEEGNEKARMKAIDIFNKIHEAVSKRSELAEIAFSPKDAFRLEKEAKHAVFLGIENGYPIGNDLSLIKRYYDLGARYITLCHTLNNDICDSSTDTEGPEHGGLSRFGSQVVEEMNRLGMIVDISHVSDETVKDVLSISKTPVIASHSCVSALWNVPRNLNDELLKQIAENGGVIQVCFMTNYLKNIKQDPEREVREKKFRLAYRRYSELSKKERKQLSEAWDNFDKEYPENLASVADLVDHIDHITELVGVDHVGIGSDFDGGGRLADCTDVSQMGNITLELVKRGYTEKQIRKIWGGNFMRVFSEVISYAEKNAK